MTEFPETAGSFYNKSSLNLLYGGMRKTLFVDPHPLGGLSAKNVGLKVGKAFFDLQAQELEYKEAGWRVKMNMGGTKLFNLKRKIGAKTAGQTRNNIQFGTDESHFGVKAEKQPLSVGGMCTLCIGGILTTSRLKLFNDKSMELFVDAKVAGVQLGCDMRVEAIGKYRGFLGASYGLPNFPVLKNVHVGTICNLRHNAGFFAEATAGFFAEVPLPSVEKAVVGVELVNNDEKTAVLGAQLMLDDNDRIIAKIADTGVAQISFLKKFKAIDLRMGIEANSKKPEVFSNFGAQVTLKQ